MLQAATTYNDFTPVVLESMYARLYVFSECRQVVEGFDPCCQDICYTMSAQCGPSPGKLPSQCLGTSQLNVVLIYQVNVVYKL